MRKLSVLLAMLLTFAVAGPIAAADKSQDFHGTFDQAFNGSCQGESAPVTGKWNVSLKNDGTASVDIIAFTSRGLHHASWGGNYFKADWVQQPVAGPGFSLLATDVFGFVTLSFVLDDQGALTFTIDPYCEDGTSASMIGTLVH